MQADNTRVVAVFDFDGTLLARDSLMPFLLRLRGPWRVAAAALRSWRQLALLPLGGERRDGAKAALLGRLLAGVPVKTLTTAADAYAAELLDRLRPDVVDRLRWHQAQSHEVAIISASPDAYLRPLADRLGVSCLLSTRLEVADGSLTGALVGANVRGPEKVRQLSAWLAGDRPVIYAYGDSAGDRELLAAADVATWVTRKPIPSQPVGADRS